MASDPLTFGRLVALGTDEIRHHAANSVAVSMRLLEMLEQVLAQTDAPERRIELLQQAAAVLRLAEQSFDSPADQAALEDRYLALLNHFGSSDTTPG